MESNLPRGRTNINIWNNRTNLFYPLWIALLLLMAYHQTGGLVRSVTDRTGRARQTPKIKHCKNPEGHQAFGRQDRRKKPDDPTGQGNEYGAQLEGGYVPT